MNVPLKKDFQRYYDDRDTDPKMISIYSLTFFILKKSEMPLILAKTKKSP